MVDFFEQEVNVELLLALHPAFVVFLHGLPVQNYSKFGEQVEKQVPQEHHEVEVLDSKRPAMLLLEYLITEVQLIAVFAV